MANAYCKEHSGTSPRQECAPCQEVITNLRSRPFPLMGDAGHIPWALADEAYLVYVTQGGRGQSLERLAQRGGFSVGEMDEFRPGWRPVAQEINILKDKLRQATQLLLTIPDNVHDHECRMRVGERVHESCTCHCKPLRAFLAQ